MQMINAFRVMADLLDSKGYTVYPIGNGGDEEGLDLYLAANLAAELTDLGRDEIEAAFAGWLLLRGEVVGTWAEHADAIVSRWERNPTGGRPGAEVAGQLRIAAEALTAVAHVSA